MAKTTLDLTAEELRLYHPDRKSAEWQTRDRRERALELAREAACLLRDRFRATRVVAFGSLAHQAWFNSRSDVDLAAWGIPAQQFFQAVAAVTSLSRDFRVQLVDPESCRSAVRQSIDQEGIDL